MAKKKFRQQEKAIQKIWNGQSPLYMLLVMALISFILILSSAEHPKYWIEKDIVVSDISTVTGATFYHQITDINGATYSIDLSNENAQKLVIGNSYHIIHARIHRNRIKYMTDSKTVYVDYEASIDDYYARITVGWAGILISSAITVVMICSAFRKIRKIKGRRVRNVS